MSRYRSLPESIKEFEHALYVFLMAVGFGRMANWMQDKLRRWDEE